MRRLILFMVLLLLAALLNAQGKLERYSCKTPVVTITYSGLAYNGYNYNWIVYYSVNTFNCRWISSGVVAGYYNSTPDYYYLTPYFLENTGNSLSFSANTDGNNVAGPNQVPFYARAFVVTADGIFYSDNAYLSTGGNIPILATASVSSIGTNDAYSGGSISSDGGVAITAKGVIWGDNSGITVSNYAGITNDGSGTSSFSSYMSGLTQGTSYYVKAYATNSIGTGYGDAIPFTTQQSVTVPIVSTTTPYSIASTTAYSGGSVSYSGSGSIIERGVCWNTSGSPNYNNLKTTDGTGTGSFTSFMSGLLPSTTYYVRAYAKASGIVNGFTVSAVGYGNELSFTTTSSGNVPTLATEAVASISTNSAVSGGTISSDGGSSILSKGVQWSLDSGFSAIDGSTNDGTGSSSFTSNISGLDCLTSYYIRAYATNSTGTGYGNVRSFTTTSNATATITGFSSVTSTSFTANCDVTSSCSNITSRGIIYSLSPGVTFPSNSQICGSGTGTYNCTPYTTLSPSTTYYVKSYAVVNGSAIYLSLESTVTTLAIPPFDPCTLSVGDSYGGGIVAYIFQSGDPGYVSGECHGIIAATSDQGTAAYFGCYGSNLSGASSMLLKGGEQNTIDIVTGCSDSGTSARLCYDYSSGSYSDWWLPSLNELLKLYTNRALIGGFNISAAYSSSSEVDAYSVYSVNFVDGSYSVGSNTKLYPFHVRAIRYF